MSGTSPNVPDLVGEALATLRDVEGVRGSFLASTEGKILARDLPSVVDARSLADAGVRVARLYETLATEGDAPEAIVLRFSDHKLHVRIVPTGLLVVLSEVRLNLPSLKMAATLVARRIDALDRLPLPASDTSPPSFGRAATMTPIPPTLASPRSGGDAEPSSKRHVTYRGRRIG